MKISNLIPEKLKFKLEGELRNADINISLDKLIAQFLFGAIVLAILIEFSFSTSIKLSANFIGSILSYYFVSLLIAIGIISFYLYTRITLKKIKKRKEIENVLADYLQLVAANLGAGMPIDQAMWYAIRERFGILAQEVEIVARRVTSGVDLEQALIEFTNKYDSELLKRSMLLLIEGLRSGGELSNLVSKIAWNIKETQILEREINAEVTTYVIFITAASIAIAPFLYALSHRIIIIMSDILTQINLESIVGLSASLPLKFGGGQIISPSDFKTFIFINLGITSVLAAMIVSTIKKGDVKAGLKLIPAYLIASIIIFLIMSVLLTSLFKNIAT